jgi:4,5-DOPA dioxygenase extradiol
MSALMPVLFLGHGNPMNALQGNAWSGAWAHLGQQLPRPRAILAVSAHWYQPGTAVTAMSAPRTIHDFGGFPPELFAVEYPAPGSPELAASVQQLLAPLAVRADHAWGLDHGTWSVLCHMYPKADIPVVQLSIDADQAAPFHHELGRRLRSLRAQGVLILGSGNIVHNLRAYAWGEPRAAYDWALRFEAWARGRLAAQDHEALAGYLQQPDARLSVPTPEHYLPLLYVLGAGSPGAPVSFPVEGMEGGSISMLAVQIGDAA